MADKTASSYSVAPSGNGKINTDILGNTIYQNNYVFYAREAAADETDRQENYDFLEGFSEWLEEQNEESNLPKLPGRYKAEELRVSNIMLFDINEDGTGLYQVQLQLEFRKESDNMSKYEVLKAISDIKVFSSLIFDILKDKETPNEIESLLAEEIPEEGLQVLESIARKGYPLSLERKQ